MAPPCARVAGVSDALAILVPTFNPNPRPATETRAGERASVYPSVNELGRDSHRGGRKSDEYAWLFSAVRNAAALEMARTGWWTADYYVDVHWSRVTTSRRPYDPMNGMKVEMDSLEPSKGDEPYFAGVYANDRLVIPHPSAPQYDPTPRAVDRIRIVVVRRWHPILVPGIDAPKKRTPKLREAPAVAARAAEAESNGGRVRPLTLKTNDERIRTLEEIPQGELVSIAERDALLRDLHQRDNVRDTSAPRARGRLR
jgi:hypothetical protein